MGNLTMQQPALPSGCRPPFRLWTGTAPRSWPDGRCLLGRASARPAPAKNSRSRAWRESGLPATVAGTAVIAAALNSTPGRPSLAAEEPGASCAAKRNPGTGIAERPQSPGRGSGGHSILRFRRSRAGVDRVTDRWARDRPGPRAGRHGPGTLVHRRRAFLARAGSPSLQGPRLRHRADPAAGVGTGRSGVTWRAAHTGRIDEMSPCALPV